MARKRNDKNDSPPSVFQMRENLAALASAKAKMADAVEQARFTFSFDGKSCMDCGADIEEKRLALGFVTCLSCARKKEA
jgi:hypothetical protein